MDEPTCIESAAILMAVEVLLPHSERSNVDKMIKAGGDAMTVAKHYELPAQMVSCYLHSNYSTLAEKATQTLAKKA